MSHNVHPLYTREQIDARVRELGAEISKHYEDERILLVCVLKGSFVFTADLARAIEGNVHVEFLGVQSYGEGTESSGVVQITQDLTRSIQDEHVLVVEDIVDTGLTISHLLDLLRTRNPSSVKVCSLLFFSRASASLGARVGSHSSARPSSQRKIADCPQMES